MLELKPSPHRFGEIATFPLFHQMKAPLILNHQEIVPSSVLEMPLHRSQNQGSTMMSQVLHPVQTRLRQPPSSLAFSHASIPYSSSTVERPSRLVLKVKEVPDEESTSLLVQTADSIDVASLLRESTVTTEDYANYYWVGDLTAVVRSDFRSSVYSKSWTSVHPPDQSYLRCDHGGFTQYGTMDQSSHTESFVPLLHERRLRTFLGKICR